MYAEERYAGQHVQCPHCNASVAVPVAKGSAAPPRPPKKSFADTEEGKLMAIILALIVLAAITGYIRGCREDAEKNRPTVKEIMEKAANQKR